MSLENPYSVDTDYSAATNDFAPTGGRVGAAPSAVQAGKASLYKNAAGQFALANVDGNNNQLVVPVNPAGQTVQVYSTQVAPAASAQYGTLVLGRQNAPTPATYQPLQIDTQGCLLTAGAGRPTFRATAASVDCATNKVLLSIFNASSSFVRLASVNIYVPSLGTIVVNGGTVLGLTGTTTRGTYLPLFCEMYRISSHAKGTSTSQLGPVAADSSDALDPLVTVYSNSTISASQGLLHRRDALQCSSTGTEYYRVICSTERNITCRPGEGIAVVCVSNGLITANTNNGTATASVDVQATFTQAAA